MNLSEQPPSLSSRLTALAQRLGLIGRAPRQILERASHLHLPFVALPPLRESICWQDVPPCSAWQSCHAAPSPDRYRKTRLKPMPCWYG